MTFNLALKKSTDYLILFTSILFLSCSKNENNDDNDKKFTSFDNIYLLMSDRN